MFQQSENINRPFLNTAEVSEWLSVSRIGPILNYNPGQKSLGQYSNIHIFVPFLGSLLKQCILFEIFLQFSLPPPYTKLKLRKNSGLTRPILFVVWGEGLDLRELENAPEPQSVPRLLSMIAESPTRLLSTYYWQDF